MVNLGFYQHHGIAIGDDQVIHFGRGIFDLANAQVEQVDLETFTQSCSLEFIASKTAFEADEIVERAKSRIGERGYDLIENNCEHFVNWCRSGEHESFQVNQTETIARQSTAIVAKPMISKLVSQQAAKRLGITASISKIPAIAAGLADAVQATAEIAASRNGKTKSESRKIGQRAGLASSASVGWLMGGPVTAIAGVSVWVVGQLLADQTIERGKEIFSKSCQKKSNSVR